MAHVASVKIETGMVFSDVLIETSGGVRPDPLPRAPEGRCGPDERPHRAVSDRLLPGSRRAGQPGPCRDRPDLTDNTLRSDGRSDLQRATRQCAVTAKTGRTATLETRFRTLVQSPLRAGLLRYLSARPDESFDVESLMQTFGRLRLDVENCVRELVDFGVAQIVPGNAAAVHGRAARQRGDGRPARPLPRAARRRQHRRPVAVGPALPRDDRPRREDADRLRVDPHGREVGHLGADPRADRIGQGSRGADDSRAEPPAAWRSSRRSTARRCPTRCSSRKSSATKKARSPARTTASPDGSSWPTKARCSSTRSATCRSSRRPSCCACSRSGASSGSAATSRSRSTSG